MGTKAPQPQGPHKRKMGALAKKVEGGAPLLKRKKVKASRSPSTEPEAGGPPVQSAKQQREEEAQNEEMRNLETLLFGAPTSTAERELPKKAKRKRREEAGRSSSTAVAPEGQTPEEGEERTAAAAAAAAVAPAAAAWVDPEDLRIRVDIDANPKLRKLKLKKTERLISGQQYQQRLQELHHKIVGRRQPLDWIQQARLRKKQAELEAQGAEGAVSGLSVTGQEEALASGEKLVLGPGGGGPSRGKEGASLPQGKICIRRLDDANKQDVSLCALTTLDFHPTANILMTAGRDKHLRLFLVDGSKNPRLESVHLSGFPVVAGGFCRHNEGQSVFLLSNAGRTLVEYDLQEGSVLLCDAHTKRLLNVMQMNAPVAGMAFHPHRPNSFLTADAEASVYEWDVRTGGCLSKFHDGACLRLTAFAVSPPPLAKQQYAAHRPSSVLAMGSRTGFTDLFHVPEEGPVSSQPFKAVRNLTTGVSTLCFHPNGELLCAASKWKKDALKLIHLPSATVFQNWPTQNTPLHYVTSAAFSSQSGLFAVGNDTGKVLLYQIRHYAT